MERKAVAAFQAQDEKKAAKRGNCNPEGATPLLSLV
jgi:hypothetical protein